MKVWVNGVPTCHLLDEEYRKGSIAFKIHSAGSNPKTERTDEQTGRRHDPQRDRLGGSGGRDGFSRLGRLGFGVVGLG
jgi:hypothetical protein